MENISISSYSSPKLGLTTSFKNPTSSNHFLLRPTIVFPNSIITPRFSRFHISATSHSNASPRITHKVVVGRNSASFARISTSTENQTTSVGVNPDVYVPPPSSSQIGSPLFWIGVGVALTASFTWAASWLKNYAMKQAFKAAMGQMGTQNNPFNTGMGTQNNPFNTGASPFPFPFPMPPTPQPTVSPSQTTSRPAVTVDIQATQVKTTPAAPKLEPQATPNTNVKAEPDTTPKEAKKNAFVDITPEDVIQESPFESFNEEIDVESSSQTVESPTQVSQNGSASKQESPFGAFPGGAFGGPQSTQGAGPGLSVEALEKMMEDPTVQKMVYPYLPEEMRNPETFKWMMQNPQYRKQLEDMLNGMSGSGEWDNRMMDSLKNFDLSSPEVKQQFDQIGMTPEEVINKIMANPEVAMAFQNPRVQQAIMDCSANPLSIAKYQNDKEVMDVFNKISELFPGATGPF
ncbi:hypothetical protein ACFE04_006605 [Oxalis oulophora]